MTFLLRKFISLSFGSPLRSVIQNIHSTVKCTSYEGDGKTTVTVLNKNFDYGLMIDNMSEQGFILNNGIRTIGPMIIFSKTLMSWNIATSTDMKEECFSLLLSLQPKLDIVVIGLDDDYPFNAPFLQNIKEIFKKNRIPVEILPVHRACSTFNFVNAENRYAAGALIPPKVKNPKDILLQKRTTNELLKGKNIKKLCSEHDYQIEKDPKIYTYGNHELESESSTNKKLIEVLKVRSAWKEDDKGSSYKDINPSKLPKKKN